MFLWVKVELLVPASEVRVVVDPLAGVLQVGGLGHHQVVLRGVEGVDVPQPAGGVGVLLARLTQGQVDVGVVELAHHAAGLGVRV